MSLPRRTAAFPLPLALIALVCLHGVSAQITSNATCLSEWGPLYNTKGQSPCLVGAYLGGACNDGQYDVGELNEGEYYIGPTSANADECQCSTVMYNVMSACNTCQNATIISWMDWKSNCKEINVGLFPEGIPLDTAVPGWAYEDFTTSTFNPSQAIEDKSPDSTATWAQTTNSATQGDSGNSPSATSFASSSSSSSKSNTGAIAGGVVAGVLGIAFLALLGFLVYRRHKKNAHKTAHMNGVQAGAPSTFGGASGVRGQYALVPHTSTAHGHAGSSGAVGGGVGIPSAMTQQRLYDPNDPTTFPKTPVPGSIHGQSTGHFYTPSLPQSNTSGVPSQGANQGMYRGIAEV